MEKTLSEIAALIGGTVHGNGDVVIGNLRPIDEAGDQDLSFFANVKYFKMLATTRAAAVLVPPDTTAEGKNLVWVKDPYAAFAKLLGIFYPLDHGRTGISPDAYIDEGADVSPDATLFPRCFIGKGAKIAKGAVIYPGVFIGQNASVGEDSVLYANVSVYAGCIIGKRVILHSGVVIGADGFGFATPGADNTKVPQVGIVQIDDDVELGANTTVDRATMGTTRICRNVKIDNLVQVAHNVTIGENSAIAAQTGISGSTKIGKSVMIGGQVGIVGHIAIGDYSMIGASSNIHKDLPDGSIGGGSPFLPRREWLKVEATKLKLPEMRSKLEHLMKQVQELDAKINKAGEK